MTVLAAPSAEARLLILPRTYASNSARQTLAPRISARFAFNLKDALMDFNRDLILVQFEGLLDRELLPEEQSEA